LDLSRSSMYFQATQIKNGLNTISASYKEMQPLITSKILLGNMVIVGFLINKVLEIVNDTDKSISQVEYLFSMLTEEWAILVNQWEAFKLLNEDKDDYLAIINGLI
jgi:hypothetical protein